MTQEISLPIAADNTSPQIIALCEQLVGNIPPVYLEVELMEGSIENDCYGNVAMAVERSGGSVQYGWQIWETLPGLMAEAEFHAVWADSSGGYHDVTQKSLPDIDRILFLPEQTRKYEGRQIDNVRIALKNEPLVHKFIKNAEDYFEATNRGWLANFHGAIIANNKMLQLQQQQVGLFMEIMQKFYSPK